MHAMRTHEGSSPSSCNMTPRLVGADLKDLQKRTDFCSACITEKNSKTTTFALLHDVYPHNHKSKLYMVHVEQFSESSEQCTSYPIMGCIIIPLGLVTSEEIKTF